MTNNSSNTGGGPPDYQLMLFGSDDESEAGEGGEVDVLEMEDMEVVDEEVLGDPAEFICTRCLEKEEIETDIPEGDEDPLSNGLHSPPHFSNEPITIFVPAEPRAEESLPDDHEFFEFDVVMEEHVNVDEWLQNKRGARTGGRGRSRGIRGRGRGRGRGCGQVRGRGRGGAVASTAAYTWSHGDPLLQVCVDDDDVPPLLRSVVVDLARSRAQREATLCERRERQRLRERDNVQGHGAERDQNEDEQEFFEVDDGRDRALLEDGADRFEWFPMDSFQGVREAFVPEQTGCVTPRLSMYDAFRAYWDDGILEHIVTETNRYASSLASEAFRKDWKPTNIHEILVLFAFWMMLGIMKMPTIKSCFSTQSLLKSAAFRTMFTYRRYTLLCRALHFANNDAKPPNASRLYLLGPILDHLNEKFQENYIPKQNVCIDESLTLWKGLLFFKQYITSKVARYGIKSFELCESATGYLWSFMVYTGKGSIDDDPFVLKSTSLVIKLMRPLLGKGYTLFMDNAFNSPILARYLKRHKVDVVGTLRSTRRGVPPLLSLSQLRKGEILARHSGDIVVQAWQDKKKVMTISTYHGSECEPVTTGKGNRSSTIYKPKVILDYNKGMGGVDRKDQMLEPYLVERKRHLKWYMKMFKRLLNTSTLNARILVESSTQQKVGHLISRLNLVEMILKKHLAFCPTQRTSSVNDLVVPSRGVSHWPVRIPQAKPNMRKHARRRCARCQQNGRKNQSTMYMCEQCVIPLCIECFKSFHVT